MVFCCVLQIEWVCVIDHGYPIITQGKFMLMATLQTDAYAQENTIYNVTGNIYYMIICRIFFLGMRQGFETDALIGLTKI